MPQGRIQPQTWFVEFELVMAAAPAFAAELLQLLTLLLSEVEIQCVSI